MGRAGRWLRENRLRLALAIAVVETLLVITDQLGWFAVVGVAAVVFALWWLARRYTRSPLAREATTMLALSQVIPLLAPVVITALLALVTTVVAITVLVLVAIAVIALVTLLRRRR